jgi:phage-related minor tail protein
MLKSDFEEILREIDSLNQKFTEHVAALKSEITIELNNRKSEMREQSKRIDLLVQEINHDMVVKMSDVRTNIEAMKMGITQNIVCKLFILILGVL